MSAEPTTDTTIHGPKRSRHTLAKEDTTTGDSQKGEGIQDPPRLIPSSAPPDARPLRTSAQRRMAYLASQPPHRQQIIEKHLGNFRDFADEARGREGRSDAYSEIGRAANKDFRPLSRVDKAKLKKRRRMFKKGEVTVPMWKALAKKVFGCCKFH